MLYWRPLKMKHWGFFKKLIPAAESRIRAACLFPHLLTLRNTRARGRGYLVSLLSILGIYLQMSLGKACCPPAGSMQPLSSRPCLHYHRRRNACIMLSHQPPSFDFRFLRTKPAVSIASQPFLIAQRIENSQVRVILIGEWLVGRVLHLLVVLLEQSLVDLHGRWGKGDTGDEVL